MAIKVGSAPDSWGVWFPEDPRQPPWERFLDEIAEAGYEWLELGPYGYLPTDPATLRRELERRGLKLSAAMVMDAPLEDAASWLALESAATAAGELLSSAGARHLVLIDDPYSDQDTGDLKAHPRLNDDDWRQMIDTTHRLADLAADRFGAALVFHPHADTHVEYENQIERFLEDTDPARVSLCLDIGHHAYRGGDPVAFIRKHHERIPYLHLKSVDRALQQKVEADGATFAAAVGMGVFCEPKDGVIDFPALATLLHEIEFDGFAIVEQDMFPADFDRPLPAAKRTLAYLREIGIAG